MQIQLAEAVAPCPPDATLLLPQVQRDDVSTSHALQPVVGTTTTPSVSALPPSCFVQVRYYPVGASRLTLSTQHNTLRLTNRLNLTSREFTCLG